MHAKECSRAHRPHTHTPDYISKHKPVHRASSYALVRTQVQTHDCRPAYTHGPTNLDTHVYIHTHMCVHASAQMSICTYMQMSVNMPLRGNHMSVNMPRGERPLYTRKNLLYTCPYVRLHAFLSTTSTHMPVGILLNNNLCTNLLNKYLYRCLCVHGRATHYTCQPLCLYTRVHSSLHVYLYPHL